MTVADQVNSMTGNSFNATLVTSAITTAEATISGIINETYVAGNELRLDTAVALTAANTLKMGKVDSSNLIGADVTNNQTILTEEVQEILALYLKKNKGLIYDNTISSTSYVP